MNRLLIVLSQVIVLSLAMVHLMGCNSVKMPALKTYFDIKVKSGWHYSEEDNLFRSIDGQEFSPEQDLPKNTQISYMTPGLASANPETLSADEKNLTRYLQVIFPRGVKGKNYLEGIQDWPCVEEVRSPLKITPP